MSNDACVNLAVRIRDGARDDALAADFSVTGGGVSCPNFCIDASGNSRQTINSELFKRQPGQALALITAIIIPFPVDGNNSTQDLVYADSFPSGLIAYFCDPGLSPGTDITDPMVSFTSAFVVVGAPGGSADPCGILQVLCGPATPP